MSKVSYYTAEGLKKLREELNHLKDVERPRASQAIAEARDKGDLSENAEYDAAKEAQGMLEMKIAKMECRWPRPPPRRWTCGTRTPGSGWGLSRLYRSRSSRRIPILVPRY